MGTAARFATIALVGLMLAACQGNSGTPSATTTTRSPSLTKTGGASPSSSGSPASNGLLTTRGAQAAVDGRDYTTLYTVKPHADSGAWVTVLAVRDDGSAVIVYNPAPASGEFMAQSRVGVQTLHSRTLLPAQTGARPRQAIEAAAHGRSFVWLETKSTDLYYQDWKIFAAHVGQRQPILLGDSFEQTGTDKIPPPPGVKSLTTDGVHAWWTMPYPTKGPRGWGARIMVRDNAGHEPLTVAIDRAKLPAATAGGVAYVRSKDVDPAAPASRYDIRLLRSGADTSLASGPLAKDEQVSTMCASDTLIAWAVRSPDVPAGSPTDSLGGRVHVMTLATKGQQTIQLNDTASSLDLSCGDTFVAWGNGSGNGDPGQYVIDVPSGKIWKLGAAPGISAVLAAGDVLGWTLPPTSNEPVPVRVAKWHGASSP